jgi:hypothetical protein
MQRNALLFSPAVVLLGSAALMWAWEFWVVGIIADPETVASYHFGSEAMMYHGGKHYGSATAYSVACLTATFLALAGLASSLFCLRKAKNEPLLKAYGCAGATVLMILLVGSLQT